MTEREIKRALRNESLFQEALWELRGLGRLWHARDLRILCTAESTLDAYQAVSVRNQQALQRQLAEVRRGL